MTDADNPTPESERGDIMREHRPQNIEVDYGMLLARGQDAATRPSYAKWQASGFGLLSCFSWRWRWRWRGADYHDSRKCLTGTRGGGKDGA